MVEQPKQKQEPGIFPISCCIATIIDAYLPQFPQFWGLVGLSKAILVWGLRQFWSGDGSGWTHLAACSLSCLALTLERLRQLGTGTAGLHGIIPCGHSTWKLW